MREHNRTKIEQLVYPTKMYVIKYTDGHYFACLNNNREFDLPSLGDIVRNSSPELFVWFII